MFDAPEASSTFLTPSSEFRLRTKNCMSMMEEDLYAVGLIIRSSVSAYSELQSV
jgi:hypothetical protein